MVPFRGFPATPAAFCLRNTLGSLRATDRRSNKLSELIIRRESGAKPMNRPIWGEGYFKWLRSLQSCVDRKSVVSGKSVSVRVDLGCRRFIQNKTHHTGY